MKKLLSLIFVLVLSASLLFGCAPSPRASAPAPAEESLQAIEPAAHTNACAESIHWVSHGDCDYSENTVPESTAPAPENKKTTATVPSGLCPVCADDACDVGKHCDDRDDHHSNRHHGDKHHHD